MNKQFQLFLNKIDEDSTVFEDLGYLLSILDEKLSNNSNDVKERYLSDIIDRLFAQFTSQLSEDIADGQNVIRKDNLK